MRRAISAVSALAVATVLPFVAAAPANAAEPALTPAPHAEKGTKKLDNRSHPRADQQSAKRRLAVEQLVSGDAALKGRGQGRTIQLADGSEVDYPASQSANLLTFLVEFGSDDPADLADPEFPADGPLHNEIAEPAPSDNTTYWKSDFNQAHFKDMFFNGMPDQNGESFKDLYDEMSSGRFDLEGDVSDWVQVPHAEAYYSDAQGYENQPEMTAFIGDSANAWFDAQATAGMSDAEIKEYLADFDVWDRYDADQDGNFNEPDGYIDHFQAVHAGEGEEAGAPIWTIWSHRWGANLAGYGTDGPAPSSDCSACAPQGGVQIGDSGYWIGDYTTEPENGGLGVFAHEFGHDLGLPDYYDTGDGDNSNGYWSLMDSGSWLGHGEDSIGTGAGHMGPTEKLFLGWYGAETPDGFDDLAVVDGLSATPQEVNLGPSYHATSVGKQAVLVTLPDGHDVGDGPLGDNYLYSGMRDGTTATATSPTITLPSGSPTLTASVAYSIETDYDFAYLEVSDDGGATFTPVMTSESTGGAGGTGLTGVQATYTDLTADLSAYAGEDVTLQWTYVTDGNTHGEGLLVQNLSVGSYSSDFGPDNDWTLNGFFSVVDGTYEYDFSQSYMAENRTFDGYDETLAEGPYSFDYANSAPNKVDHYSYEDGLLVYYSNGAYGDNNTSEHLGYGANLPVDSQSKILTWSGRGGTTAANGRLQSFDSTFDVDQNSPLNLTREVSGGSQSVSVPARAAVPVFEDTDPEAYWDDNVLGHGWFSTKVAGVGTEIQVVSSDETTGKMVLKVGKRFVAALGTPAVSGTPQVGQTLTAAAPVWFQTGVATTVAWLRDGSPIAGATGTTYQLQAADQGHSISAQVTGSKAGYTSTTLTTAGTAAVTQGGVPVATKAPSISGTARVGKTLTVTGGTWPVAGTSTFAWTIGSTPVGTGTSYTVKPANAGKKITVTETFTAAGYAPATSSATSGTVAKAPVGLKVAVGKATKGKKVSASIKAVSPDLTVPGKVKITYGGKSVGAKVLKNGKVTVKLPGKKKGKYKLKVSYLGATGFSTASKTVTVKVK